MKIEEMTIDVQQHVDVKADIGDVFKSVLHRFGPGSTNPNGESMQMVLEQWPGGRWFRDLGNNTGHFWGLVQAIKAPSLLEISGPLFMSSPAVSNIQYRLTEERGLTRVRFVHRAMGWIGEAERGVDAGWTDLITRIRTAAEKRGIGR